MGCQAPVPKSSGQPSETPQSSQARHASQSCHTLYTIPPPFSKWRKSGFESKCIFAIGSQLQRCRGSQPKHVRLWYGAGGPNQKHVRLWYGAGGPDQNTSRIQLKKLNPHFVCRTCRSPWTYTGSMFVGRAGRPAGMPAARASVRMGRREGRLQKRLVCICLLRLSDTSSVFSRLCFSAPPPCSACVASAVKPCSVCCLLYTTSTVASAVTLYKPCQCPSAARALDHHKNHKNLTKLCEIRG